MTPDAFPSWGAQRSLTSHNDTPAQLDYGQLGDRHLVNRQLHYKPQFKAKSCLLSVYAAQVDSLEPATHAYSFWEGVPVSGKKAFGRLFAQSRTLRVSARHAYHLYEIVIVGCQVCLCICVPLSPQADSGSLPTDAHPRPFSPIAMYYCTLHTSPSSCRTAPGCGGGTARHARPGARRRDARAGLRPPAAAGVVPGQDVW